MRLQFTERERLLFKGAGDVDDAWMYDCVDSIQWLRHWKLGKLIPAFMENEIDLEVRPSPCPPCARASAHAHACVRRWRST